jgi:hypothetical protein
VAAHPNLLIDLLMTMPWYLGMVWIFARVQQEEQFPWSVVLLLGAIYELGADGIVGGMIMPAIMGESPDPLIFLALMGLAAFWQFIPVYSSLVLPAAWILERESDREHRLRWWRGLRPLIWLIPFTLYLIFFMLLISGQGS